ncbi:hypothetical protein HOD30_00955 [Candidatus Peregrinibacteria bacterium]|jgi:hypothetical protein|nr:hypothetical protein [Candidatus Peregrinibacteria bacterium]MBT4631890.1 hypothetical protein [Candidatus Peregrinibacteria bacterium]MBT5516698.1 hypothetical protein [Candidatus Peregrinibacteria bacterium]MBT5824189.1 hypothetical protein [Candidatus Peregrinibacteria bacterium]
METLDILYLTLAGSVAILTIFISVTLVYLLSVLRDVVSIADKVKSIADKIDTYVTKPILMTRSIIEFVTPFIHSAEEKIGKKKRK